MSGTDSSLSMRPTAPQGSPPLECCPAVEHSGVHTGPDGGSAAALEPSAPRVSVIVAVRDGEHCLRGAVESVLAQTFSRFEVIVVDDGSTDGTWELIGEFAARDSRIVPLRNSVNRGQPFTRNRALAIARGEYIAIQDADDLSYPDRLAIQLEFMDTHPDVGALGSAVDEVGSGFSRIGFQGSRDETLRALLLVNNCMAHSTLFARTELVRRIGGYAEEFLYSQDYDLWCRLAAVSRLHCLPSVLVRYRFGDPHSVSVSKLAAQRRMAREISLRFVRQTFPGVPVQEDAYTRFWTTVNENLPVLRVADLRALEPLWSRIRQDPYRASVYGWRVAKQVWNRRRWDSLLLLRFARREFSVEFSWSELLRSWLSRSVLRLARRDGTRPRLGAPPPTPLAAELAALKRSNGPAVSGGPR
jgi:glycosyltransferase involved in cell wall biosynthesis